MLGRFLSNRFQTAEPWGNSEPRVKYVDPGYPVIRTGELEELSSAENNNNKNKRQGYKRATTAAARSAVTAKADMRRELPLGGGRRGDR